MKIKERPEYAAKTKPLALTEDTAVSTAINQMASKNFGSVVVINNQEIVTGIVTERDLMIKVLYQKKNPEQIKLSEIMTEDVRTATEDDNVFEWLRIMSNERFRHLPIVDKDNHLINLMSQGDFVSYTWPALFDNVKSKTKDTVGRFYEIFLIILAMLAYALAVNIMS